LSSLLWCASVIKSKVFLNIQTKIGSKSAIVKKNIRLPEKSSDRPKNHSAYLKNQQLPGIRGIFKKQITPVPPKKQIEKQILG